jgi:hypothetical protein
LAVNFRSLNERFLDSACSDKKDRQKVKQPDPFGSGC